MKIILIGDENVGKSTFKKAYFEAMKNNPVKQSGFADVIQKTYTIDDLGTLKFQIWDISGSKRFQRMLPSIMRGTNGSVLIFDVSRPETLDHCVDYYKMVLKHSKVKKIIPAMLVGNKTDLREDPSLKEQCITFEEGKQRADQISCEILDKKIQIPYFELSNCDKDAFETILNYFLAKLVALNT